MCTRKLTLTAIFCSLLIQNILLTKPLSAESKTQAAQDQIDTPNVFGIARAELTRLSDLIKRDLSRVDDDVVADAVLFEWELLSRSLRVAERFDRKMVHAASPIESIAHEFEGTTVLIQSVGRIVDFHHALGLEDTEREHSVRELNEMLFRSLESNLEDWSAIQNELLVHLEAIEQLSGGSHRSPFGNGSADGFSIPEGSQADRVLGHGFSSVMNSSAVVPLMVAGTTRTTFSIPLSSF